MLRAVALVGAGTVAGIARRVRADAREVLIVGDSMIATAFGKELEKRLAARPGVRVRRVGKSSTGLARPDFFDWQAKARRLHAARAADTVICMMGGNDAQALFVAEKKWIKWGAEGWDAAYVERLERLRKTLLPSGGVWISVGLPIMRARSYDAKIQHIDGLIAATVRGRPEGHFLDTRALLGPGGRYRESMRVGGRTRTVRAEDGVHITLHGARFLADHVDASAQGILGLAPAGV